MCDYSLMAVPNRLAQEGEELVAHRFPTGSLGLASPGDLKRIADAPAPARRNFWNSLKEFFNPPKAERSRHEKPSDVSVFSIYHDGSSP